MLALESSFVCANTNNHCAYRWSTTHAYARAFSDRSSTCARVCAARIFRKNEAAPLCKVSHANKLLGEEHCAS